MKVFSLMLIVCTHLTTAFGQCNCDKDFIVYDDWILAFRAEADIGISVYDTWMDDTIYHDSPVLQNLMKPECVSFNSTCKACQNHFKSRVVTMWDRYNINQVHLLMLKDSEIKAGVIFDGQGSDKTSWFSQDRVITSSWTDLKTAPSNVFSIHGQKDLLRRFFMSSYHSGCPGDSYWLIVNDGRRPNFCKWDNPTRFPKFIYSTKSTSATTGENLEDFEYADVMMILVQVGD